MKLLADPSQKKDPGELLPIPHYLKKAVPTWAGTDYRQYDFGFLLIQEFISNKFSLFIWRIMVQRQVLLYPSSDKPILALQFTLQGNIPCVLTGFGNKLLVESTYELFYVPVGKNQANFEPGEYESFHIEMEASFLEEASKSHPKIKALLEKLNSASAHGTPLLAGRIDYQVKTILNSLRRYSDRGKDTTSDMQKYIVELLSHYLAELKRSESRSVLPNIDRRETLIRIRDQILQNPDMEEQTLKNLSQQHRIHIAMLKRNFKTLFGETLVSFVRIECLKKARWLLSTSGRSVKDIADEIGYPDKSNFAKAYRRQFGMAPNENRKGPGIQY